MSANQRGESLGSRADGVPPLAESQRGIARVAFAMAAIAAGGVGSVGLLLLRAQPAAIGMAAVCGVASLTVAAALILLVRCEQQTRRAVAQAEQAGRERTHEADERLRAVVGDAPFVRWSMDPSGRLTHLDGPGLERLGSAQEALRVRPVGDHPYEGERLRAELARALAGETIHSRLSLVGNRWEYWARPVLGPDGRVQSVVGIAADTGVRQRAEGAARQDEAQRRESEKMDAIGRLAGGIAHDFNNLLTAIAGHAELLGARLGVGEPGHSNCAEIRRASGRAAELTQQLLAFSRRQILQPREVDLDERITSLLPALNELLPKAIELRHARSTHLGAVSVDPRQVEQILHSLASNARDAMPDGGKLILETTNLSIDLAFARRHPDLVPGPYVMLAVSDNGCGMDAEIQALAFEPFFTTKEQGKGTGLGLSTVYGIVKQSGGAVWLYSEPGLGTTVKIALPRSGGAPDPQLVETVEAAPQGTETVLVIEDEESVRDLVQEVLQRHGYRVLAASGGPEAIAIGEQFSGQIQLVLTDVVMPQMSGREAANQLAKRHPESRVLYMSGYTANAIAHHSVLDPGIEFIQKPFTVNALTTRVRQLLDQA